MKIVLIILIIVFLYFSLIWIVVGATLIRRRSAWNPWLHREVYENRQYDRDRYLLHCPGHEDLKEIYDGMCWIFSKDPEEISVRSADGLKLSGHFVANPAQRGIAIMVHGYRSCALYDFSCSAEWTYDRGLSLLLIDQRSHGSSEGRCITMGEKERFDVNLWLQYIKERFGDVPVVLIGVSMGAATILLASGQKTDANLKAIVADCGYTAPGDIFRAVLRPRVGVFSSFFLFGIDRITKIRCGFHSGSCDARTELAKNRTPILFIHGEADSLVPCGMSRENYRIASAYAPCRLLTVPGAEHGISYLVDRPGYQAAVTDFLNEYLCEDPLQ